MRIRHTFLLALVLLMLTACSTTPRSEYYRLVPLVDTVPSGDSPAVGVGPVSVAGYLQRPEIVTSGEGTRLQREAFHRWGEPLDAGVARVVAINLAGLLNTERVYLHPWRKAETPDIALRAHLLQFELQGGEAKLVVEWSLTRPATREVLAQRIAVYREPAATADATQVPAILSRLLLQFSREVAAAMAAHPVSTEPPVAAPAQE